MTTALITGVAGFIGSHVAGHCLDLGFDIVGIDDLSGGSVDNVRKGVVFGKGTIIDNGFLARLWDEHIVFRPHNVYGERQNIADKYRNVVGIFMNQIMSGNPTTIFDDGRQTRAFSYIDDVAPIIARAPLVEAAYGEEFNIGADQPQ